MCRRDRAITADGGIRQCTSIQGGDLLPCHVQGHPVAAQNGGTDTDTTAVKAALAEIGDPELAALIGATRGVPQIAPGLPAWLDGTCDWELNCWRGFDYTLQLLEAALDPNEDEVSINAAVVLRDRFAQKSPAVRALFDALVGLLTGGCHMH